MSDRPAGPDWEALVRGAGSFGVVLDQSQVGALERYLEMLLEWNRRFNLTAIDDPDEILVKHFLDSLSCAAALDFSRRTSLVDVGTGAGFPGLVLKIGFPHLRVTLLDAVAKRLGFLERVIAELDLSGIGTVHARAEDAGSRQPAGPAPLLREGFDVAVARAVARLNVLAEWLLPLARPGGAALAMKGPDLVEEVREAERAVRLLGGGEPTVTELVLPDPGGRRSLVLIPKLRPTPPAYPRRAGSARKAPL